MRRKTLLKGAAALMALPSFVPLRTLARVRTMSRVRPSDVGWPKAADWEALRRNVSGNLMKPAPFLSECETAPGSAACSDALKQSGNPYYIGDHPSGTQVSGWLDAWNPEPSAYAVAAKTAADVVAAVKFAREHRLRLVVKGGGHSYQGTSNAADSLLIWTRHMKQITLHDAFVPKGCSGVTQPVPAVTVQAGAVWMDVYDAVTTQAGRYVQGGGCATVGVAGLIQSGGFGSFSKRFGNAAGGLLEAEVVTADGVLRTVNACTDSDLFWALKGGGGGSWGVVTSVTLRTHDLPDFFGAAHGAIKATSDESFIKLLRRLVDFYADNLFNPHWGESINIYGNNSIKFSLASQGLSTEAARAIWQPFLDWIDASPNDFKVTDAVAVRSGSARKWWDVEARRRAGSTAVTFDSRPGAPAKQAWWAGDQEQVGEFLYGYESVWLPASLLQGSERERLVDALFAASREFAVGLHFNKGLAGAPSDAIAAARDTATNPAVLNAFALAIISGGGAPRYPALPAQPADNLVARDWAGRIDHATEILLKVAPSGGSYVSESNFFNRSWQKAFWGENYAKLRTVKSQYDPDGLFFVHHGVGSEDWSPDGFIRMGAR